MAVATRSKDDRGLRCLLHEHHCGGSYTVHLNTCHVAAGLLQNDVRMRARAREKERNRRKGEFALHTSNIHLGEP